LLLKIVYDLHKGTMGRWIIIAGLILVVTGIILHFAPWLLNWFGKLPGDIRIETERSKIFIPVTSMVVMSIILTVLINLFRR
jgi:H+/Cl- antiporter ClcA